MKKIVFDKSCIEQIIGFEINDFKLEPLFEEGVCIGLNVHVEPKIPVEEINISLDFSPYKNIKTN